MASKDNKAKRSQSFSCRSKPCWSGKPDTQNTVDDFVPIERKIGEGSPILQLSRELAVRPWRWADVPILAQIVTPALSEGYPQDLLEGDSQDAAAFAYVKETLDLKERHITEEGFAVPDEFAITLNNVPIGNIGMSVRPKDETAWFVSSEVAYFLAEEHQGKGIMTEVVTAFVPWLFRPFRYLDRVEAFVLSDWAPSSVLVLKKSGFTYEGTMRQTAWKKQLGYSDDEIWRVLRDEHEKMGHTEQNPN